jgi:4-hydroxybenzoyl-CoA thioesterase
MKKLMKTSEPTLRKTTKRKTTPNTSKRRQFTVRRIVNWGDCDPAGIVYTPRVLDYACETVDAWQREELKASWWHVNSCGGPGLPTVKAVCDFISILRPDQSLELRLYIREIGRSSITFEVEGVAEDTRLAFRVTLVSCAIDLVDHRATPIPDWMREKLEAYQRCCT